MSGGSTRDDSAAVYAHLLDSREQLIERHYHHLTRIIRPQNFFAWLRAKGVFTVADQEEVEHKYMTTCLKAGHLVDVIGTKGKAGFVAFMEVIEFEYPETYTVMSGKQARLPPDDCEALVFYAVRSYFPIDRKPSTHSSFRRRPSDVRSADMIALIGNITAKLTRELADKNSRFAELQQLIDRMKSEREQETDERDIVNKQLQNAEETIEDLTAEKDRLSEELSKISAERDEFSRQCTLLRAQKDAFMDECTKLKANCGEMQRTLSCRPSHDLHLVKHKQQQQQQQQQHGTPHPTPEENSDTASGDDVKSLRRKLMESEKKARFWSAERSALVERVTELERQCQVSQESSDMCLVTIEQLKTERDQGLKQNEELEKKNKEITTKCDRLEAECGKYVEKFRRMEETIKNLYHEIDQMKLMRPQRVPPRPARVLDRPDFATNKTPIILFSPDGIHRQLMEHLQSHYSSPYVTEKCDISRKDVIHEIPLASDNGRSSGGSSSSSNNNNMCLRLTFESLQQAVTEVNGPPCLFSVPIATVKRLINVGFSFVVVYIKFKSKDGSSEVSEEEEGLMEACCGRLNKFVPLEVEEIRTRNMSEFAQQVRATVSQLYAATSH